MFEEAHEFHLSLISLASNFAEMLLAYFSTVLDKDCPPKVLYERITEKFVAEAVVVFSEDACKQISCLCKLCLLLVLFS